MSLPVHNRKLGFWMCLALVMGNMIGSGVFLLPAALAPFGWDAVLGWLLTIGGALCLAFVFSRLTNAFPEAGGPVGHVGLAFGKLPEFAIGWCYWVSIWTANVTIAVAAISYLSLFAPVIGTVPGLPALLSIALIWAVTLVNLRGARAAGTFQLVTLIAKLVPLAVVAVIIVLVLARSGSAELAPFPKIGFTASGVTASAALTLWALLGFESATVACDKAENAPVNVPRATILGTLLTGILYLFICSGIALLLPVEIATGSDAPFALFVERFWSPGPALFIGLFAAISAIGALNGWILMQGEVPLAMARAGTLPAWLGVTGPGGTPARALLVSSALASIMVIVNSSRSMASMFEFMALLSTSAALWLYLVAAAAAMKLRIAVPVALVGVAYSLWTLWGAGIGASGLSLILMAAGLPIYWWVRRTETAVAV